ncbi:hypothetical protein IHE33_09005 [Mycetohabitans endofungorum]|uniref:hypothetical protein n=1 Tax=Mycetohabitans endofungorum TaxID=417203 RepID=UPI0030CE50C6
MVQKAKVVGLACSTFYYQRKALQMADKYASLRRPGLGRSSTRIKVGMVPALITDEEHAVLIAKRGELRVTKIGCDLLKEPL